MDRAAKIARLKAMLIQVAPENDLDMLTARHESFHEALGRERLPEEAVATDGLQKLAQDQDDRITDQELDGLEAIILLRERPVVLVKSGAGEAAADFEPLPDPWTKLNAGALKQRIVDLLPSIGRIELPGAPQYPYGGTGFVVGPELIITNRHVARLFTEGLGDRRLSYRPGDAAIDFHREADAPPGPSKAFAQVREILLIHPYWDMALLRVDRLPAGATPLSLSVEDPEGLVDREVVVIGYPARDDRNDLKVQDRIFKGIYMVKRLQPGRLRARAMVRSFENRVSALTHDSSTLGGNSGSAIIDLTNGQVVALHFAGEYLKANYAVPSYEMARDARVVAHKLSFAGSLRTTADWDFAWRRVGGESIPAPDSAGGAVASAPTALPAQTPATGAADRSMTWMIPLHVTVSLGLPVPGAATVAALAGVSAPEAPSMQVPMIYDDLSSRDGYRPEFLELGGDIVSLPALRAAGKKIVALLEDGTWELKYHKFSIVMHKRRRLALFTAANTDWRPARRLVNGRKPTRDELTGLSGRTAEQWVTDPRIPGAHQLPDVFFTKDKGAFDKGHLVRRDDVCWGDSFEDIQMANGDTFHTTNCSPQIAGFNRSGAGVDNWGDLENLVQSATKAEKAMLFAGPVLRDDDPEFEGRDVHGRVLVQIPQCFWKIVVVKGDDGPEAYGFVLEQDLSAIPWPEGFAVPTRWKRHMQSIGAIDDILGGLVKLTDLKRYDRYNTEEGRRMAESVVTF
jgi:endonuclease G